MFTLPESERLKGRTVISALMTKGRWGGTHDLKYCFRFRQAPGDPPGSNRVMVSVPKRLFRSAVKRNLLKRRLREAYRIRKHLLSPAGTDLLLLYNTSEILDFQDIGNQVEAILKKIGDERRP